MMGLEEIIITFTYFGILFLMTLNGFISFPSSQLVYIIAGYFAFTSDLNLLYIILIGALGQTIGNLILYEVARKKGVKYSIKFIQIFFPMLDSEKEVRKLQIAFNKRQKTLLFIGKLANPSKIFIPIPAGIAKMNRAIFLIITYITSSLWALGFALIGYYFGKSFKNFGFIGIGLLIAFILVMIYFYRLMNSDEVMKELNKDNKKTIKKSNKNKTKKN